AAMANPTELQVHFRIAPDYYMYRQRFGFEADAPVTGEPIFPRGTVKYDPTFDEDMEVYHDQVTIRLPLQAGASQPLPVGVAGPGCAGAGQCYPPMAFALQLVPAEQGCALRGDGVVQSAPPPRDEAPGQAGQAGQDTSSDGNGGLDGVLGLGDTGLASY